MAALGLLVLSATTVLQQFCILFDGGLDETCTTLLHFLLELERERPLGSASPRGDCERVRLKWEE